MPASFVWQPGPTGGTPTNAANLNRLAVVADIGTAGTPTGDALKAAFVPKWQPSTNYAAGDAVLNPSGQVVTANAVHTSGSSYNAANWTVVSGSGAALDQGDGEIPDVPAHNVKPVTLPNWQNALLTKANPRLLLAGDSTTLGVIGTTDSNGMAGGASSYPGQLATLLNSYTAKASYTLGIPQQPTANDGRWTAGTGWGFWQGSLTLGFGGRAYYNAATTATGTCTYAPGNTFDTVVIYYATGPTNPTIPVTINGVAQAAINASGSNGIGKTTYKVVSNSGSIVFGAPSGGSGGQAFIFGVETYVAASQEIRVMNAGVGGTDASQWTAVYASYAATVFGGTGMIQALAPDLTIIMLGINDSRRSITVPNFTSYITAMVAAAKVSGDAIIMSCIPSSPDQPGFALEAQYQATLSSLATSLGVPYIDIYARMSSYAQNVTKGFAQDVIGHLSAAGYADIAKAVFRTLITANSRGSGKATTVTVTTTAASTVPTDVAPRNGVYTPQRSLYLPSGAGVRKTRAKIAAVAAGVANSRCKIAWIGHGEVSGYGGTPGVVDPVVALRKLLATRYPVGTGLPAAFNGNGATTAGQPIDARYALSATSINGGLGAGTGHLQLNRVMHAAGDNITFTSDVAGTIVDIVTLGTTKAFSYSIDGAAAVTITPSGASAYQVFTITGLSNTTHTVLITQTGTGGNSFVHAVNVRPASAVEVSNFGFYGSLASDWAGTNWYDILGELQTYAPDLTLIQYDLNEALTSVSATAHQTALTNLVTSVQATGSEVVLVASAVSNSVSSAAWSTYRNGIYNVADAMAIPVLDLADRFGTYAAANAAGFMSDANYPNGVGYTDEVLPIFNLLTS